MNATGPSSAQVTVELSDCSAQDAAAVFDVLRTAFPQASPADGPGSAAVPPPDADGGATVWTETFDIVGAGREVPEGGAGTLTRPVSADVQGGYLAVDQLRTFLASVFAVSGEGAAFGDQEKDVHLCLANR
ncbi:hypothetical protein [Streptomyces flavofungini]|uniref:hypothetical protein n=1 Tax=Streptomyces flavofungini TaxID=68200 RepID=UPI0025B225B9|nr:hypothetical protein [Streptomyces flavofungini]WJV44397.1 hypothetical protein QUY26_01915 [Streptomyces flavofungini]